MHVRIKNSYIEDPLRYKFHKKYHQNIRKSNGSNEIHTGAANNKRHQFRLAVMDTFDEYVRKTKVSGMWLLQPLRTQGFAKWIWSTLLLSLLLLGIYLSLQLWLKFYSYPILNTISNDLTITDVEFPGVTICSHKMVNNDKVKKFVRELRIPEIYNVNDVIRGFEYINSFTDQTWMASDIDYPYNITDTVLQYNKVTIFEAAGRISSGCDEFVKHCFWGMKEFPCRQKHDFLSFKPTTTYLGSCCSFNQNTNIGQYIPISSNIFGTDGGLTFIGTEGSEDNISRGLTVLVHHPMDFVTESTSSVTITSNAESFVEIFPTVQSSAIEVLELSEEKRDCLISNDLQMGNYRQATCALTCQKKDIFEKCNCYPYNLVNGDKNHRECKLNDTECYSKNFDAFRSVPCDHCLPNCYDVTYSVLSYKTDLFLHNFSINSLYYNANITKDSFVVRVYMAKQIVPSIRKVTVMSWISLLSDLGGVFNLCLGLSIISLVELVYYCTYRLYINYKLRSLLM